MKECSLTLHKRKGKERYESIPDSFEYDLVMECQKVNNCHPYQNGSAMHPITLGLGSLFHPVEAPLLSWLP
jgi:hypothetical protein